MLSLFPERTVFLEFLGFQLRWYGLLYVVAISLAWWLTPQLANSRQLKLTREEWLYVITSCLAGVLIGGRLGYALLYEPAYFLAHPQNIFFLRDGGMSSHGGFLGVALALLVVSRRLKIHPLALADAAVIPAAVGLALGRVGNFINQELYVSPHAHVLVVAKDLFIAGAAYVYLRTGTRAGGVLALFLVLYGLLRFATEYLRTEPHYVGGLTHGQWLTLPILISGGLLFIWLKRSEKKLP